MSPPPKALLSQHSPSHGVPFPIQTASVPVRTRGRQGTPLVPADGLVALLAALVPPLPHLTRLSRVRAPEESEKRRRAANGEGPDLDSLPPQEREQAIKMMEIARRAEERAARRRQEREANGSKSSPNGQGKVCGAAPGQAAADAFQHGLLGPRPRQQPRSLNDLVKDKKKQDKKLNQVKFVPKAERKKLREQQEREAREQARQEAEENERRRREYRRRLERELKEQEELDRREKAKKREEEAAEAAAERQAGSRGGRGRGGGSGPSRGTGGRGPAADKDPAALSDEAARQKEVEAIKQQHLGGKKRSTKVRPELVPSPVATAGGPLTLPLLARWSSPRKSSPASSSSTGTARRTRRWTTTRSTPSARR